MADGESEWMEPAVLVTRWASDLNIVKEHVEQPRGIHMYRQKCKRPRAVGYAQLAPSGAGRHPMDGHPLCPVGHRILMPPTVRVGRRRAVTRRGTSWRRAGPALAADDGSSALPLRSRRTPERRIAGATRR
jgi:hypothetical protein